MIELVSLRSGGKYPEGYFLDENETICIHWNKYLIEVN